jgi:hypothetical protein
MLPGYCREMDDSIGLLHAIEGARARLASSATRTAAAQTGSAGEPVERLMSESAKAELFAEALLHATKSRFAEIKTVTKQ